MDHELDQDRQRSRGDTSPRRTDDSVEPGRLSRSALLRKPEHSVASGLVQRAARDGNGVAEDAEEAVTAASASSGASLPESLMRKFEGALGSDLSGVRVHTGEASQKAADAVGAKAYTMGNDIHFGAGHYDPSSATGEQLLAHEVAHTVQQSGGGSRMQFKLEVSSPGDSQEQEADRAAEKMVVGEVENRPKRTQLTNQSKVEIIARDPSLTSHIHQEEPVECSIERIGYPLTESEISQIGRWLRSAAIISSPNASTITATGGRQSRHNGNRSSQLSSDAENNIDLIAAEILIQRVQLISGIYISENSDYLAIRAIVSNFMVHLQSGVRDWTRESIPSREMYAMDVLVRIDGISVEIAAGLIGNLMDESELLPNRIEGSLATSPMRSRSRNRSLRDFTAQQIMNGTPDRQGVGIAQWTNSDRRRELFNYSYNGVILGASIIYNMDAQLHYLASRALQIRQIISAETINQASDAVFYRLEIPGVIGEHGSSGGPTIEVRDERRRYSHEAYDLWMNRQVDAASLLMSIDN